MSTPLTDALVQIIEGGHEYCPQDVLLPHSRRLERDRKELTDTLHELLKWGIDSKSIAGAITLAAIHGYGETEETPHIVKAIADARALLSRMEKT